MNPRKTAIAILAALCVSLALADDFTTNSGKIYKHAKVQRVEPDGIVIKFAGGVVKIPFEELSTELQKRPITIQKQPRNSVPRAPRSSIL